VSGAAPGERPSAQLAGGETESNGTSPNGTSPNGGKPNGTAALEAPHRRQELGLLADVANFLLLSFWRVASWCLRHLPAGPSYRVGGWLSMIGYAFGPKRRRWLRANFGHVLGVSPSDRRAGQLARAAYRNYARYIMEVMRLPGLTTEQAEARIEADGLDRFMDIYRNSNGLILVSAHLGNNEAMAAGMVGHGLPVSVVGDDTAYSGLYELLNKQRQSWGVEIISWRNLRGVYGVLRRKECLGLLVDWGYRPDGIPVKMFDSWTTLPAGPALLAARHGSTIVPILVQRLPDGRFRASAADPILVPSDGPADLARATQAIADDLARFIAVAPEQWYIFKPIWPATPEESAELEARHADMLAGANGKSAAQTGRRGAAKAAKPSVAGDSAGAGRADAGQAESPAFGR
jgi:lauroyl/myristoyl acyltransferase